MNILPRLQSSHVESLNAYNVNGDFHVHPTQGDVKDGVSHSILNYLCELLLPIEDASHTRDRKRSPPDSACMAGTRVKVVQNVNAWARSPIRSDTEPHMRWMHGYVGSGKSSISQEVCDTSEREDRPVVSFFFFRNAGDRSKIWRLATTLAYQMAAVIPETEPFIRSAARANRAVLRPAKGGMSLGNRMRRLVYAPFKAALQEEPSALGETPFLIVLDGLDECEDKDEVQELIDGMLLFFKANPFIPLRVFITSRVEKHIQSRLNVPGVKLDNLVDHCSDDDIATFLGVLFEDAYARDAVVQAYVREHGEWPTPSDRNKLVQHIGGSFIFASVVFKFIMGSTGQTGPPSTPMDRLPLALKMNPGLDGMYAQTLARSEHLPHFRDIISTIALLQAPLPTSGIAEILGINTYKVVNVLVDLQAIIQVPGTDDIPITLCHTSLRDFLTSQTRSGHFLAHPRHHVRLFLRCLEFLRQKPGVPIHATQCTATIAYALEYSIHHLNQGKSLFEQSEIDSALQSCREALESYPDIPDTIHALAELLLYIRARRKGSLADFEEAISVHREALELRPSPHPHRSLSLHNLGSVYLDLFRQTNAMDDLEEAISLYFEALELRPSPHPERSRSLDSFGTALLEHYRRTGTMADLEEAISLHREALELRPSPHPERSWSLSTLGSALLDYYRRTGTMDDLEEVISLHREALELRPLPHPGRWRSLNNLGVALVDYYRRTGTIADLGEAISLHREALELRPSPHSDRSWSLSNLGGALVDYYRRTGTMARLEEAISLHRETLELRPLPDPERPRSLNNLGVALVHYYLRKGTIADLEEAISLHREALELRPSPHPDRLWSLNNLGSALVHYYWHKDTVADLEEAVSLHREALELRPSPHPDRLWLLNSLGSALLDYYRHKGSMVDLEEAISLHREALELQPMSHPERSWLLTNLAGSLQVMYQESRSLTHLQEAITHCEELLATHYSPSHKYRAENLNFLVSLLQTHFAVTGNQEDLARIERLKEEAALLITHQEPQYS